MSKHINRCARFIRLNEISRKLLLREYEEFPVRQFKASLRSHKLVVAITLTSQCDCFTIDSRMNRYNRITIPAPIRQNKKRGNKTKSIFYILHFIACAHTAQHHSHRHGIWFSSLLLGHCCWFLLWFAWSLLILFIDCRLVNRRKWWMYASNARIK